MLLTEIIIVVALIVANGIFAGAEIAVISLRKTRIQALVEAKRAGAKALATLRRAPERFLATVQIGITVVGTTAAAFGGASLAVHIEPLLARTPWIAPYAEEVSLALLVAFVSYLSLVLGELVPKSLALRAGETYALMMARPLLALSYIARPLVRLLTATSNVVLRPFSDRTTFMEARLSREELGHLVEEAAKTGALDEHTRELASRVLEFDHLNAADVMVPRNRVTALPVNASHDEIKRCLLEEHKSRMPIYEGTLDNVVGYVTAKDLLSLAWEGKLIVLGDVLRPVQIVGESTTAAEILRLMRREHHRLLVVVDEHGALAGLVTFEDVVEELVGEVFSEHEKTFDAIVHQPDGALLVRGDVPLRDLNRVIAIPLSAPEGAGTVSGLCVELAGGAVPHPGARLAANDGIVLVIEAATARAVRRVRVIVPNERERSKVEPS